MKFTGFSFLPGKPSKMDKIEKFLCIMSRQIDWHHRLKFPLFSKMDSQKVSFTPIPKSRHFPTLLRLKSQCIQFQLYSKWFADFKYVSTTSSGLQKKFNFFDTNPYFLGTTLSSEHIDLKFVPYLIFRGTYIQGGLYSEKNCLLGLHLGFFCINLSLLVTVGIGVKWTSFQKQVRQCFLVYFSQV